MSSMFRSATVTVCCVIAQMPAQVSAQVFGLVSDVAMEARDNVAIADVPRPQSLLRAALATLDSPSGTRLAAAASQDSYKQRDSVLDGVLMGAGMGAAGGALGAWLWCQGDYKGECDDEPGQGALIGRTALIGAGAGAALGWVFDLNRSPRETLAGPTLAVAPVASMSRKAVHLMLRY